jgi:hypothetical protein
VQGWSGASWGGIAGERRDVPFSAEIFGRYRWGRLMPFLFIWQFW